jgi:hypothetical protein
MTENKYHEGKIYKITSSQTDKIYIGSTTKTLYQRLRGHKLQYKHYLNGGKKYGMTSFELIKLDDYKIELVENVKCENKKELLDKEKEYILKFKDICLNKFIPTRTIKEYYQDNKEEICNRVNEYRLNNLDTIKEKKKKWAVKNKDKLKIKKQKYSLEHKDDNKKRCKEWYEENKEKIKEKQKEKIICKCGGEFRKSDIRRHEKTKLHINFLL